MTKLKKFASGALSSGSALRFDLIPRGFLERVAARFGLGAKKYGERVWCKGLADRAFIVDRLNHLQTHVQAYLAPQSEAEWEDDNLGGIACACAFLSEVENDPRGREILASIRAERGAC